MTSKDDIMATVQTLPNQTKGLSKPIFEIMVFEHANKEDIYPSGKHSGLPDMGATDTPGFYHDIDHAYDAIVNNMCDIRETVYDAAFLLCRFPGLYQHAGKGLRMYFVYNKETGQYEQKEEPEIFAHIAL